MFYAGEFCVGECHGLGSTLRGRHFAHERLLCPEFKLTVAFILLVSARVILLSHNRLTKMKCVINVYRYKK